MPIESPTAAWRRFLESTPASTPVQIAALALEVHSLGIACLVEAVRIQLHCDRDDGVRWFEGGHLPLSTVREYRFLAFTCRDCGEATKVFAVLIERKDVRALDVEVMKLGEYPPFAPPISKRVQKLLRQEDLELYRKGHRAEAQGLGIGAATYFRRIVESQWQLLVREIREAAEKLGVNDLSIFDRALEETQFSAAVKMLKDAIPQKLLILGGENPLTLLYHPLSEGLHGLSDEQCLQQAADIRTVLTALLENIADVLKDQKELQSAAARLKQRKV